MNRWKELGRRLAWPGLGWRLLLLLVCGPGLIWVFASGLEESPLSYALYALSTYTLIVWCIPVPGFVKRLREGLYQNRLSRRYLTDLVFRGRLTLVLSALINTAFALFKLGTGVVYRSVWFGALGLYYLVLAAMRILLTVSALRRHTDRRREFQASRLCGWLLLALTLVLSGVILQMVRDGRGYSYPGYLIFVAALYTFYSVSAAVVNLFRFRRLASPALITSKALGFAVALVSLLSLQTAMFAAFGEGMEYQKMMNALTGAGVCTGVFVIAILTIRWSGRGLRTAGEKEN
ncbi:MAG: hypothetical protein ACI3VN_06855 [Candidatus Onthomonas sp.]